MSYSVCIHGGSMCDGCMACYEDRHHKDEESIFVEVYPDEEEEEEEEEEEDDD